ncbi:MAG: M48 family metalloprotease [Acidobacteria bacterium]|nr:M48 family metalloprotease [Acidobacteriota bacterium]MBI3279012.1 M48 family metalloprotease [Acidobacteriota bacterium]
MRRRRFVALAALLLVACGGRKPGEPIRPGFNVFSKEQDVELGRQAAAQVRRQADIVDNPELRKYVQEIGQRLASPPQAGGFPYEFTLINDKSINAFALPGGPVFVNTGLIAEADNEAQVAGVLAHEIAHVALRHGTNQASKAQLLQLPAAIAGAVIGDATLGGQLGQLGLSLGFTALMLKYSRSAESEADALGARLLAQAGYNPVEMARFFEKLEAQGGSRAPQFLSSHPNPGNRMRAIQAEIQTLPQAEYRAGTGRFESMQQLVARLPQPHAGEQRARLAEPNAPPDGSYQQINSRYFSIAHPSNWEALADNQSGTVAIAPRQGFVRTQFGGVAVGYGALLSYYRPQRRNLPQATAELIRVLQQANPMMEVAGGSRRVQAGSSPGLVTQLRSASPYGGTEIDYLLTVARPEGLFYMVFVAPEGEVGRLQPAFERMIQSLRFRG